jgi:hypothetical protein
MPASTSGLTPVCWITRVCTVVELTTRTPGNVSGLELESKIAQLMAVRGELVGREQDFLEWDKVLRAVGLDPDAIALPSPAKAGQAASSAG